jgi:hypothetical protein
MAIYQDDKLVKRAYTKVPYSEAQIDELRECMHPITGPEYFIRNYMYIQHPIRGREKIQLYDFQIDLIYLYHNYRRSIAMVSRQMGKSTIAAGYLLWYAMFNDDSTVLISSNKFDGAQDIMHRVRYAYESVPDHIRAGAKGYAKRSIDFDNGSRIMATTTTENTGRGLSISLIYLDELSAVSPGISRELWASLSPTLSTGGKCIITSTPNTDEDQFAEIWFGAEKNIDSNGNEMEVGVNGFRSYKAIWDKHPDRDQKWADSEYNSLGEERFRREHCCSNGDTLITLQDKNGNITNVTLEKFFRMCKIQQYKNDLNRFDKYFSDI